MNNIFYKIEIQTTDIYEITDSMIQRAMLCFHADLKEYYQIEDRDDYHAIVNFFSDIKASDMPRHVRQFLEAEPRIYYIDVIYRYPREIESDRFVLWQDGRVQTYTGKVMYTEDNNHE